MEYGTVGPEPQGPRQSSIRPGRSSMNNGARVFLAALVLASGMVISAVTLSKFFLRIRHEQNIGVKGYAEKDVVSDVGKFSCTFRARGPSLQESYAALQNSREAIMKYLKGKGFLDAEMTLETIEIAKIPRRDAQGKETNQIEFYDLSQSLAIESANVALLKDVSTSITELIREGIDLNVAAPQFYVKNLKDTKIELLAQATEDGYRRAVTLADKSRGKVGPLVSAEQGVFQVTPRNSTDTSGYGVYDTSTIEKTVKAIVTLEYEIRPNDPGRRSGSR